MAGRGAGAGAGEVPAAAVAPAEEGGEVEWRDEVEGWRR